MVKPRLDSGFANKELDKAEQQIDKFQEDLSKLTPDALAAAPIVQSEPQTKISDKQARAYDAPKISPAKSFPPIGKLKPEWKNQRDRDWEYVKCVVENKEIQGEDVEFWYGKWPGDPTYLWKCPVNRPIYIPRMVAEHLQTRCYHRFKMEDRSHYLLTAEVNSGMGVSEPAQSMVCKETHHRIDARAVGFW